MEGSTIQNLYQAFIWFSIRELCSSLTFQSIVPRRVRYNGLTVQRHFRGRSFIKHINRESLLNLINTNYISRGTQAKALFSSTSVSLNSPSSFGSGGISSTLSVHKLKLSIQIILGDLRTIPFII